MTYWQLKDRFHYTVNYRKRGAVMDDERKLPLDESYWVDEGRFMAGEYPGAAVYTEALDKLSRVIAAGIDTFVDLTENGEPAGDGPLQPYHVYLTVLGQEQGRSINYYRKPIRDLSITTNEQMINTLDLIDAKIAEGRTVYVHCRGGIGRTGTVVGCYLARHGTATGIGALEIVEELGKETPHGRRGWRSPETLEQIAMVRNWHEAGRQLLTDE